MWNLWAGSALCGVAGAIAGSLIDFVEFKFWMNSDSMDSPYAVGPMAAWPVAL